MCVRSALTRTHAHCPSDLCPGGCDRNAQALTLSNETALRHKSIAFLRQVSQNCPWILSSSLMQITGMGNGNNQYFGPVCIRHIPERIRFLSCLIHGRAFSVLRPGVEHINFSRKTHHAQTAKCRRTCVHSCLDLWPILCEVLDPIFGQTPDRHASAASFQENVHINHEHQIEIATMHSRQHSWSYRVSSSEELTLKPGCWWVIVVCQKLLCWVKK